MAESKLPIGGSGFVSGPVSADTAGAAGATWLRINDSQHQYGGPGDAHFIMGDMNTFDNVFMGAAGRGIVFGQPVGHSV